MSNNVDQLMKGQMDGWVNFARCSSNVWSCCLVFARTYERFFS